VSVGELGGECCCWSAGATGRVCFYMYERRLGGAGGGPHYICVFVRARDFWSFGAVDNKGIVVWAGVYAFLNEMR
jgi:hypothetical protein